MSWHFSQALVEAYSAESSSDGGPSAPSSGTPTHGMFWSPDKTTEASTPSRSGMTFKPSTESRGEDLLMWCQEVSRVRTSVPPGKESASKASDPGCGNTWHESSVKFDPVSSSWKTHRCLWEEDLPWSSVTLPKWGMMRDGVLWERTTPELPIEEKGSGYWPTPVHSEARQGYQNRNNGKKGSQKSLTTMVVDRARKEWPTPVASDTGIRKKNYAQGGTPLSKAAWMWPTPAAQQQQGGVQGLVGGSGHREKMKKAGLHEMLTGSLNPNWVEWLMGWPVGWTDCGALEMDRFRMWPHSPGTF